MEELISSDGIPACVLRVKGNGKDRNVNVEVVPVKGVTPGGNGFLVLFEDAEILALNKPAGLSSQGGRGQVNTLDELLWAFAKPGG